MLASQPVGLFRAIEIVQAVVTNGQVPQHRSDVERFAILQKFFIGLLIDLYGFLEPVLAKINVGDIAVQPRKPELVLMFVKNSACFLAQPEGPFILAVINQALQRAADGAGVVDVVAYLLENIQRFFIFHDRFLIFAGQVKHMTYGACALRRSSGGIDLRGNPGAGLGHALSFLQVDAGKNHHGVVKRFHRSAVVYVLACGQKFATLRFLWKTGKVNDPLLDAKIRLLRHLKSQLRQDLLEPVETTATDEADGSSRQTELLGHFFIRHGRLFIEHQLYQLREARGEPLNGVADGLLFLNLLEDHRSGGNFFRQFLLHGVQLDLSPLLLFPVKTLMGGYGNQPRAQRFDLPQLGKIGEKIDADILENVAGIVRAEAILDRHGVNQALVLIDKRVPRLLIAAQTLLYQPLVLGGRSVPDCG